MPRGPRVSYPHAVFHVINRFVDRHPFFKVEEDYSQFLETYFETAATFGIWTYAYDLIPNHFHIVLETPSGEISRFLQRFLTEAVQRLNRRHKRIGHLMQGRTKTLLVQTDCYFHTVLGYVLLNGVRAGLARDVFSDPRNSVKEMFGRDSSRLARGPLWEYLFGREFDQRHVDREIRLCRTWLKGLDVEQNVADFRAGHKGGFLSTDTFRKKVLKMTERRKSGVGNCSRRKTDRHRKRWSWTEIRDAAERAVAGTKWRGMWRNHEAAVRHLRWYIAVAGAGWKYETVRVYEESPGLSHSRYAVAIHAIRTSPQKKNLAEKAVQLCLN
jgi:REP element-mobilizing transposase RayT